MSKAKGTRAERELFHLFWKNNFAAIRSAGSGSTTMPAPDILAGNKNKLLAIECKSIKNNKQYFPKKEIQELFEFSDKINAKPFIGMRFDNHGWFFLNAKKLKTNKNGNYSISLKLSKVEGINFKELIGKYKQLKL
ncbi:Holliday junction resolvase [Candidatus Woesearchaeota archaeon]|jgi:holliday junction resolvase Hjr|nr:Holliday junction resolvase [Candidatus Woesearchaeota archaeon]MBT7237691.1 Holliday junction resolvase [Candidatus Woesearchaeota archaeon]